MEKEELNFETERQRYYTIAVDLAARMVVRACRDNSRVACNLGPQEFGLVWLSESFTPKDPVFEGQVLGKYLEMLRKGYEKPS